MNNVFLQPYLDILKCDVTRLLAKHGVNYREFKRIVIKCENNDETETFYYFLKKTGVIFDKVYDERYTYKPKVDLYFVENELHASNLIWSGPIATNWYKRDPAAITFKEFKNVVSEEIKYVIEKIQNKAMIGKLNDN